MSFEDYRSALKLGQKEYRSCVSQGKYPYLQVLDEILDHTDIQNEAGLGLVDIPIELIVGTKTEGRRSAFARNFMPLLDQDTEFSAKWISLCDSHLEEGIRDPIVAYEFQNRFYVAEGNKRVSVLKFFGAVSVPGRVTRIVPKRRDTTESKLYYEFLDFYRLTSINLLWFSQPGRFRKLLSLLDCGEEPWSQEDRSAFLNCCYTFRREYEALSDGKLSVTPWDALLSYLQIYGKEGLYGCSDSIIRANLTKIWKEITIQSGETPVELVITPQDAPVRKPFLPKLRDTRPKTLKAAFLYQKSPEETKWTYHHELGRKRVESALKGRLETVARENVAPEMAADVLEEVVAEGCQVVFTTNPKLLPATLRCAVEHPEVRFLNCSVYKPHPSLRTYYGRMYEARFLTGLIAGGMSENGRIGYVSDYPILGVPANLNAFAMGARMVNPRAKIFLEWSSQRSLESIIDRFRDLGVDMVSNQDVFYPRAKRRDSGLYRICPEGGDELLASTVWNWGKFYELILRDILSGGWNIPSGKEAPKAINYWWGLSAEVVDIRYAKALPVGIRRLVEFMRDSLISGAFRPFTGKLVSQNGVVQESGELTAKQIVTMDWLVESIVGSIPDISELTEEAQKLVAVQGIHTVEDSEV